MNSDRYIYIRQRGFSLIEVLIAVVVLATGLLALASLQSALTRTGAESRDRSIAISVAKNIFERTRAEALAATASYVSLTDVGTCGASGTQVGATGDALTDGLKVDSTDIRYCRTVQRYVGATAGCASGVGECFVATANGAFDSTVPEFKTVSVQVSWKDAKGVDQSVVLKDIVSGIPLANSKELKNRHVAGTAGEKPRIRIDETLLTSNTNFIPIAVDPDNADSQRIAATNPTPKVSSGSVSETSFSIYTYTSASNRADVQRQIDTKVVGCRCTRQAEASASASADGSYAFNARAVLPSYWDGLRYVVPKFAAYGVLARQKSAAPPNPGGGPINQSEYCDACCRDHHDPSDVRDENFPRFDEYRTTHTHFRDAPALETGLAGVGHDYYEVCRLVRTDGVFRVTPDSRLEHYAFLPTDSDALQYTTSGAASGYSNFARAFVESKFTTSSEPSEDAFGLNSQAAADLQLRSADTKYIQNRGIFLDYPTKGLAANIEADCGAVPATSCILPFLPFVSINLTELTTWTRTLLVSTSTPPKTTPFIQITPKQFSIVNATGTPLAGHVTALSGTATGSRDRAGGQVDRSLSVLANVARIFYSSDPASWAFTDSQNFIFNDVPSDPFVFEVHIPAFGVTPWVRWISSTTATDDCDRSIDTPTKFVCDVKNAANAAAVTVEIGDYYDGDSNRNVYVQPFCSGARANEKYSQPVCILNRLDTFTRGATVLSDVTRDPSSTGNPATHKTRIVLGAVANGNVYTANFAPASPRTRVAVAQCDAATQGFTGWSFATCRSN